MEGNGTWMVLPVKPVFVIPDARVPAVPSVCYEVISGPISLLQAACLNGCKTVEPTTMLSLMDAVGVEEPHDQLHAQVSDPEEKR